MRRHGDDSGGRERPEDAEAEDRDGCDAKATPPDQRAAVEENHDQRDDADPLHLLDREALRKLGEDVGGDRREQQEERGLGYREALAQLRRNQRKQQPARDYEDDCPEDDDFVDVWPAL
jgi:hypothetical protein